MRSSALGGHSAVHMYLEVVHIRMKVVHIRLEVVHIHLEMVHIHPHSFICPFQKLKKCKNIFGDIRIAWMLWFSAMC